MIHSRSGLFNDKSSGTISSIDEISDLSKLDESSNDNLELFQNQFRDAAKELFIILSKNLNN